MFVKWHKDVFIRQVADETIVCSPRSGACLVMRDAAPFIREIHSEWRHVEDIASVVAKQFGISPKDIASDVVAVIHGLREQRLIAVVESLSGPRSKVSSDDSFDSDVSDDFTPLGDFYLKYNIPAELHIDITDACSERCVHCYVPKNQHHFLSFDKVAKAIQEFRDMQGLSVHITGGECMLHPDFERVCSFCKSSNLNIIIFSNMTCCDSQRIAFLKELNPQFINVSLYSMNQAEHEAITQVPGSWHKTVGAILACEEAGIPCRIATPILHRNQNACKELKRFAVEHHMHFIPTVDIVAQSDHCCGNLKYACSASEIRRLLRSNQFLFNQNYTEEMPCCDGKVCQIGLGRLYLNAIGYYYPCDAMHDYVLGNVWENTMDDIWRGEKLNYLRKLKNSDFKTCVTCSNRPWCKVCPAANFNATGNMFAPPPGYCELAKIKKEIFGKE